MRNTERLPDFAGTFQHLCEKTIDPALRSVMRRNTPGWLEVVAMFKGDAPGGTDPDPNNFSTLNRHVTLRIPKRRPPHFADLSFVAWNPDVKVVRRRNGTEDEDFGVYPIHVITTQFVEDIAAQFLASVRR